MRRRPTHARLVLVARELFEHCQRAIRRPPRPLDMDRQRRPTRLAQRRAHVLPVPHPPRDRRLRYAEGLRRLPLGPVLEQCSRDPLGRVARGLPAALDRRGSPLFSICAHLCTIPDTRSPPTPATTDHPDPARNHLNLIVFSFCTDDCIGSCVESTAPQTKLSSTGSPPTRQKCPHLHPTHEKRRGGDCHGAPFVNLATHAAQGVTAAAFPPSRPQSVHRRRQSQHHQARHRGDRRRSST